MQALLTHTVAMTIALAYLLVLLFAPFLLAWFLLRIARDLRRIADASEFAHKYPSTARAPIEQRELELYAEREQCVVNSMFGR